MSQTNTNTNINININNAQNQNQNSKRDGRGQGAPNSSGRGDRKQGIDPLNSKRFVMLFLYSVLIKTTETLMKSSAPDVTMSKMTSCRLILTPTNSLLHTTYKSPPSIQPA